MKSEGGQGAWVTKSDGEQYRLRGWWWWGGKKKTLD